MELSDNKLSNKNCRTVNSLVATWREVSELVENVGNCNFYDKCRNNYWFYWYQLRIAIDNSQKDFSISTELISINITIIISLLIDYAWIFLCLPTVSEWQAWDFYPYKAWIFEEVPVISRRHPEIHEGFQRFVKASWMRFLKHNSVGRLFP